MIFKDQDGKYTTISEPQNRPALHRIIRFDPVQNVYRELGRAVGHAFSGGAALK